MNKDLPFVLYRYPNDSLLRGVFQENAEIIKVDNLDDQGFVFAPFDQNSDGILIKGVYQEEDLCDLDFVTTVYEGNPPDGDKESHIQLVNKAISAIEAGKIKKVVLSRTIKATTEQKPNQIFETLIAKYNNAFCYWWYHPKVGMWFGATPEQLLKYTDGAFLTTSLAGTLPFSGNKPPFWTQKERDEQQLVTDFIEQSLKERLDRIDISEPENQRAGKLWHLKSTISGTLNSFSDLKKVIYDLHPTPAVCGLPKQKSLDFILKHEGYDREYYTGYLGPLNLDGEKSVSLFVNLRCFKYNEGQAQVFVGGGITAESDAEKEWEETQLKSRTILEVL